jgi:hypothetical protein
MRFVSLALMVILFLVGALVYPAAATAQYATFHRLAPEILDVVPPSDWVRGDPGAMSVVAGECRSLPSEDLRRRIVDVAVQEWAFFGYPVLDRMNGARLLPPGAGSNGRVPIFENNTRRAPLLNAQESGRVASSIAGYWAVTPEGAGIVRTQNGRWNGSGIEARWNAPWSAAFISWVMCEAGLGTNDRFHRAIAHWRYIDQAIRARDGQAPTSGYVAYDLGEQTVEPGDLLCFARRPSYRTIAERRRQMGTGASSHCDIVVGVDEEGERILAIGGNVLRSVSLKVLHGTRSPAGGLHARAIPSAPLFAHLKLRAGPVPTDALLRSPVLAGSVCANGARAPDRASFVLAELDVRALSTASPEEVFAGC